MIGNSAVGHWQCPAVVCCQMGKLLYVSVWRTKLTQNASMKPSVAAHIRFQTLTNKATETRKAAARPDLILHHSLWPVSTALLLMAKWAGHCSAKTGLFFLLAHCRWNDLRAAVTRSSLLWHENPSLQGQGALHLLLNLSFLLTHASTRTYFTNETKQKHLTLFDLLILNAKLVLM